LRDIISRIETDFSAHGEVICEIRVNGVVLSESDEVKFANNSSDEIRDLAVRSNKPCDLIVDSLKSASEFIVPLEASCFKTAEVFRGNDLPAAQKAFHDSLDGCQWLIDTLMYVRGAAQNIQEPIQWPERWFEAEKIIGKAVRELSEAYSNSDFVLVADLLEYELTAAFAVWKEVLQIEIASRA
jgi:hypothetical protein